MWPDVVASAALRAAHFAEVRAAGATTSAIATAAAQPIAQESSEAAAPAQAQPDDDDVDLPVPLLRGGFGEFGLARPDSPASRRTQRLADEGLYSKALAALSGATLAPATAETADQLRALHPPASGEPLPPMAPAPPEDYAFTRRQVRRALWSFTPGSAGGLDKLTPQLLQDAARGSGDTFFPAVGRLCSLLAAGRCPPGAREFFFGARLAALEKKGGGLRPVASGCVWRRLAAKLLMSRVAGPAATETRAAAQLGVATPGGTEVLQHAARLFSAAAAGRQAEANAEEEAAFKADFSNAFNSVRRSAVLAAARAFAGGALYAHALCAYGAPSALFFGRFRLESAEGVQQGDPLGPLLFSLALARVRRDALAELPPNIVAQLRLEGAYLDDVVVGGVPSAVLAFLAAFSAAAARAGLRLNHGKCEVYFSSAVSPATVAAFAPWAAVVGDLSCWSLLGGPVGHDALEARRWQERALTKVSAKLAQLRALSSKHTALTLLRFCGGFSCGVFLSRARFSAAATFDTYDAFVAGLGAEFAGDIETTPSVIALLRAPNRLGGFGLRACAPHAANAFVCSAVSARRFLSVVLRGAPPVDNEVALATACPVLARYPTIAALVAVNAAWAPGGGDSPTPQREASQQLEALEADTFRATLGLADRASVVSGGAPFAGAWVTPTAGDNWCPASVWAPPLRQRFLTNPAWFALARRRLLLDVSPLPLLCRLCGGAVADTRGIHSQQCVGGGPRHTLHTDMLAEIAALGSAAMAGSRREARPFVPDNLRIDLLFPFLTVGAQQIVADFACHNFFGDDLAHAAATPGGAATRYEATKVATYGVASAEANLHLTPLCVDTFGAWGETALPLLKRVAAKWGERVDIAPSRAITLCLTRLSCVLAHPETFTTRVLVGMVIIFRQMASPTQPFHPGMMRASMHLALLQKKLQFLCFIDACPCHKPRVGVDKVLSCFCLPKEYTIQCQSQVGAPSARSFGAQPRSQLHAHAGPSIGLNSAVWVRNPAPVSVFFLPPAAL